MVVGFNSFNSSFLDTDKGISETLTPKSHKALEILTSPIVQGIKDLPRSLSFGESLFWIIAMHYVKAMVSKSSNFLFLDIISYMKFI